MASNNNNINSTKRYDIDVKVEKLIKEAYDGFKIYLPTIQDQAMWDRKVKEYWNTIHAGIKELNNGHIDDAAGTAAN